nr:unnamed protein product [Digitaria exilis]
MAMPRSNTQRARTSWGFRRQGAHRKHPRRDLLTGPRSRRRRHPREEPRRCRSEMVNENEKSDWACSAAHSFAVVSLLAFSFLRRRLPTPAAPPPPSPLFLTPVLRTPHPRLLLATDPCAASACSSTCFVESCDGGGRIHATTTAVRRVARLAQL